MTIVGRPGCQAAVEMTRRLANEVGIHAVEVVIPESRGIREIAAGVACLEAKSMLESAQARPGEVALVVKAGTVFVAMPRCLVEHAENHGLAIGIRLLPALSDGLEPGANTFLEDGCAITAVLAANPSTAPIFAQLADDCSSSIEELHFSYPLEALRALIGAHTEAGVLNSVIDPGYLRDDEDLPPDAELVVLSHFDSSQPWLPDSRFRQPRITDVGRSRLSQLLGQVAAGAGDTASDDPLVGDPLQALAALLVAHADWEMFPDDIGQDQFAQWAASVPFGFTGIGLPCGLLSTRLLRPDLQAAFPQVPGVDEIRLAEWGSNDRSWLGTLGSTVVEAAVESFGDVAEGGRRPRSLRKSVASIAAPRMEDLLLLASTSASVGEEWRPDSGVLVCGLLDTVSGLGNIARQVVTDLNELNVPTSTRTWRTGARAKLGPPRDEGPPRTTAIAVYGAQERFLQQLPRDFLRAERRIGVVFWEVDCALPGIDSFSRAFTEIWAPSTFLQGVLKTQLKTPLHAMPPHVEFHVDSYEHTGGDPLIDAGPYLFQTFDHHSTMERKNPRAAITAFAEAVRPEDGVRFLIKTINGDQRRREHAELLHHAARHPSVVVIDETMPRDRVLSLARHAAAYVSLHRGEGLGLTIAEAMAGGTPSIATAYGGNCDFMDNLTAFPIPYVLVPIGAEGFPYPADAKWADPDVDAAAIAIRSVLNGGIDVTKRAEAGRQRVLEHFSRERFEAFLTAEGIGVEVDPA